MFIVEFDKIRESSVCPNFQSVNTVRSVATEIFQCVYVLVYRSESISIFSASEKRRAVVISASGHYSLHKLRTFVHYC